MENKHNKVFGKEGEQMALEYLQSQGLKNLESNFTIWGGELDIIMKDKGEYVFVEVKSRFSQDIPFEELISANKLRSLEKTAEMWLRKNKLEDVDWRIDFVGIDLKTKEIEWIPDCTV